jgi:hypothetical protein
MVGNLIKKVVGSANERYLKRLGKNVDAINALEPDMEALSDGDLLARTDTFRQRVSDGETLDSLLVEAFATVREAAKRTLGQRHFDVQMLGGMVLHNGMIAEMKTGEGKTLVATLAVYLNALEGKGRNLRDQQRTRLRLPARQYEVPSRRDGPARFQLRHRRRSRLDPDRRSAHAVDHLRTGRGFVGSLPPGRRHHPQARRSRL